MNINIEQFKGKLGDGKVLHPIAEAIEGLNDRYYDLREIEVLTILNWWRASNRYKPDKTEEVIKEEMALVKKLLKNSMA